MEIKFVRRSTAEAVDPVLARDYFFLLHTIASAFSAH